MWGRGRRDLGCLTLRVLSPVMTIYNWRRQDRIDRGLEPGPTSVEKTELQAARRRIAELETELAVTKRAIEYGNTHYQNTTRKLLIQVS